MLKEAMAYFRELVADAGQPHFIKDEYGREFLIQGGTHVRIGVPRPEKIHLERLDGLIEYVNENIDARGEEEMLIIIEDVDTVRLTTVLDDIEQRDSLLECRATTSNFKYNHWYNHEEFVIHLLSKFMETEHLDYLVRIASTIKVDENVNVSDDGISQKVAVKKGITSLENEDIRARVTLKPVRTFFEIEQPTSEFIFRIRQGALGIECALFDADGRLWTVKTKDDIKAYLEQGIMPPMEKVKILM